LRIRLREDQIRHEMMLESVISILEGMNPSMLKNQLGAFLVGTEVKARAAKQPEANPLDGHEQPRRFAC
jgi:flagellar motor component MotA